MHGLFRCLFTGKERDEETVYGYLPQQVRQAYHGARYMDHELMTMWLSVDPMADKYPSISPYAYCAWNPVMIIDPNGDSLRLDGTNEQREMILNYLHQYSHLSFQYDENGYVAINTELPGSEIKDKTDSYISDMITDQST